VNWFTFAKIKYLGNVSGACRYPDNRALQSVEMRSENFSALLLLR